MLFSAEEAETYENKIKELESQIENIWQEVASRDNTISEQQKNVCLYSKTSLCCFYPPLKQYNYRCNKLS